MLGEVDSSLYLPLLSMNRLNQTELEALLALLYWAFSKGSILLVFYLNRSGAFMLEWLRAIGFESIGPHLQNVGGST